MKNTLVLSIVASLTVGIHGAAQAQGRMHLGPQVGYNFDAEALLIGAQFSAPIGQHLEFYPSFNYYFVDVGSASALNLDLKYRLPIQNADWLYIGGGLNIMHTAVNGASSNDAHANFIAGIESRKGNVHPFGEFRVMFGDGSSTQLVGGLNFTLGGHTH